MKQVFQNHTGDNEQRRRVLELGSNVLSSYMIAASSFSALCLNISAILISHQIKDIDDQSSELISLFLWVPSHYSIQNGKQ